MTKGPVPKKAMEIALPVARARGIVILCQRHRGSIASFIIAGPGWTAIVYLGRTRQLNELPGNIAFQFRYGFAGLRRILPAPGRSCEIWACDYYGNLRFFRLAGAGVVEIDREGRVIEPVAGTGEDPSRSPVGGSPVSSPDEKVAPGGILPIGD
jgi:hypothetical protein